MPSPVAIVTGGSSGIGLSLVQYLTGQAWRVVIADVKSPKASVPDTVLFVETDISSWDQQAAMFKQAYEWAGRLDFCVLNAGITDHDDIFNSLSRDVDKVPTQPDVAPFKINLIGTYYGIKLAAHYMTVPSVTSGKHIPGGKIAITASGTGLYPMPAIPQYSASKHGLVGLARSLGHSKAALEANVRINAVCPAIVVTDALPAALVRALPQDQLTPMETVMRCFEEVADLAGVADTDWVRSGRSGDTVEANVNDLIWHQPPAPPGAKDAKFDRQKAAEVVAQAYRERILSFVGSA